MDPDPGPGHYQPMCSELPQADSSRDLRTWDVAFKLFLQKVGLSQTLAGFELDMIVVNDSFQQVVQPAVLQLIRDLQGDSINTGAPPPPPDPVEDRILRYTPPSIEGRTPTTLNQSISKLLAENRARSCRSNTQEFIRLPKRRRVADPDMDKDASTTPGPHSSPSTDAPVPEINTMDTRELGSEEHFSSARTSTRRVDRSIQMKYDIAKNPDGPLGRTMHGKLSKPDPRLAEGQGSGGVLSQLLKDALTVAPGTPVMARHPGLQERFDNIEEHLAVRWIPSPPEDLRLRIQSIEEYIMRMERDYPPWASIYFNQPKPPSDATNAFDSVASGPSTPPIVIPSHLTTTTSISRPSLSVITPQVSTKPKDKGKGRGRGRGGSTLLRSIMERAEVAKALGRGLSIPASIPATGSLNPGRDQSAASGSGLGGRRSGSSSSTEKT